MKDGTLVRQISRPQYGGEITVGSLMTTSDGITNIPKAPIRLINKGVEVDIYSGAGAPTFTANVGSIYLRSDAPDASHEAYVSQGAGSWTPLGTGSGTVTSVSAGVGINTTGTAAAPIINVNAYDSTGAELSAWHMVRGTASFSAVSSVTVNLTGAAQFSSGTTYAVDVDWGTGAFQSGGGGQAFLLGVDTKTASSFRIICTQGGAGLVTITATIPWVAVGT